MTCTALDAHYHEVAAEAVARRYTPPPLTYSTAKVVDVIGDSYTGGSAMNSGPDKLWTAVLSKDLDVSVGSFAVGGSGYVQRNPAAGDDSTMVERASRISPDAAVVVFFGSRNDGENTTSRVPAAAAAALQKAREAAPKAKLIVIGPPWVNSNPPSWLQQNSDSIHEAADGVHATWVDPIAADWFPTGTNLIGKDGVHPTDAGDQHLAELIEPVVKKALG